MIRINPYSAAQTERLTAKKRKEAVSGSAFSTMIDSLTSDIESPAAVAETPLLSGVNPMLGLQEVSDVEIARKQAIKRGKLTLDALDELRVSLLIGSVAPHMLTQLEKLVREQRALAPDPALASVLDDIELRAAVELAKLEMVMR